jgi:hypothetical protein
VEAQATLRFRERRRENFFSCAERLATLAIVLRLSHSPLAEEEEQALGALYPIGLKAARTACRLPKLILGTRERNRS